MKVLLMNGPNLNLLGQREPEVYGSTTLADIEEMFAAYAAERGVEAECFQSNWEGALIDAIHASMGVYDGIVYNPGAHTHYSYALHDAISSVTTPVVEIHISDIYKRKEEFRHCSVLADACIGQVKGLGPQGYLRALDLLLEHLEEGRLGPPSACSACASSWQGRASTPACAAPPPACSGSRASRGSSTPRRHTRRSSPPVAP